MERFWSKVKILGPTDCWEWTRCKGPAGYGVFTLEKKNLKAHRFAWYLTHNIKPGKWHIRHTCDNPSCCNPSHLKRGTNLQNRRDSVKKMRHAHGIRHGRSKLSEEQVVKIKSLLKQGLPKTKIEQRMKISWCVVDEIDRGKIWKHVV